MKEKHLELKNKQTSIAIIGLGYVGLPLALAFARKLKVIGFDINASRVEKMRNHIDPSNELSKEDFMGCDIHFSSELAALNDASFYVIAVPTPIDDSNLPDLNPLLAATKTVGSVLKKAIMWFLNPRSIRVVQKKIVFPSLKLPRD